METKEANKSFKKYDNLLHSDNKHCCTDKKPMERKEANKSFKKYDNLIRSDNKHCCTDKNRQNE